MVFARWCGGRPPGKRGSPEGRTSRHDRRTGSVVVRIGRLTRLRRVRGFRRRAVQQGVTLAQTAWSVPQAQRFVRHAQTAFRRVPSSPAAARLQEQGKKAVRGSARGQAVESRAKDPRTRAAGEPSRPPADDDARQEALPGRVGPRSRTRPAKVL